MALNKLDKEGRFLRYPGVTVVAGICQQDYSFWEKIAKLISKHSPIKDNYALLPYLSYHMTAINLFTEAGIGSANWKQFLHSRGKFFLALRQAFEQHPFQPKITLDSVIANGALQLLVTIPKEQEQIISDIAREFQVEINVPARFHITLGYQFKYLEHSELKAIREYLEKQFKTNPDLQKSQLTLDVPKLCFFEDMTAFIPWNAVGYPFKIDKEHDRVGGFFSSTPEPKAKDNSDPSCNIL